MDFISIIILLGIVQGFFLGILLFTKKGGNKKADNYLGILFFVFSISISYFFIHRTGLVYSYPHLFRISLPSLFLFGPILYFYVKYQTDKSYKFNVESFYHFLPFIVVIAYNFPFYIQSAEFKLYILKNYLGLNKRYIEGGIISTLQLIHIFSYIFYIKSLLKKHNAALKNSFSSLEKVNLSWINTTINLILFIFGLMFLFLLLIIFDFKVSEIHNVSIPIFVAIFIYYLGYKGFTQTDIFAQTFDEPASKKYEKSTLTQDKADEHLQKLLKIMNSEKLFRDNEMNLQKLADKLDILPHHLSQIINEKLNQNFFDFINNYRIEEAKRLLISSDKTNYTILAIAEESGFNSKTAFNTAFKKFTNQTPSEFRKTNLQ